ncbi:hypothetical protein HK100_000604, partial [Physocladia obscura]
KPLMKLPTEIRQQILYHLPVDEYLTEIALTSKTLLFADLILSDFYTTQTHLKAANIDKDWKAWAKLPRNYRALLLSYEFLWLSFDRYCPSSLYPLVIKTIKHSLLFNRMVSPALATWTPWKFACRLGDCDILESFVQHHDIERGIFMQILVEINRYGRGGQYLPVLKMLQKKNLLDSKFLSLLYVQAAQHGNTDIVRYLLSETALDPTTDTAGIVILFACTNGITDIAKKLLEDLRIDLGLNRPLGNNPFVAAAKSGNMEILKVLLKHQSSMAQIESRQIMGHRLVKKPIETFGIATAMAVQAGHLAVFDVLIVDPRTELSTDNNAILCAVCEKGHTNLLRRLLDDSRIDWSEKHSNALKYACINGHYEVLAMLLADDRVDCSEKNTNELLTLASKNGHLEVVKLLLANSQIHYSSSQISKAVIYACKNGRIEIVKTLLNESANPSVAYNAAILWAWQFGHKDILSSVLLKVETIVDKNLSFQLACENSEWLHLVIVLLRDDGVNPSYNESKSLRVACEKGHVEIVRYLLADGRADPRASDNDAIRAATQHGHEKILALLKEDSRIKKAL